MSDMLILVVIGIVLAALSIMNYILVKEIKTDLNLKLNRVVDFLRDERDIIMKAVHRVEDRQDKIMRREVPDD